MTLGEKINNAMRAKKITQTKLAEKTYITQTTISRYIKDQRTPDAIALKAICEALDGSADWLLDIGGNNSEDLKNLQSSKN